MYISLQDKVLLVTGSSRGIGEAIAKQLLHSGAKVALHYNGSFSNIKALLQAFPQQTCAFQVDLADKQASIPLFQDVLAYFGKIDGLVNNAGIALKSPLDISDNQWIEDWEKTQAINLQASALLSRQFVLHCLEKKQQGRIVFISSRAAFRGDTAEYWAYAASKAGMVALSHTIARAYGKQGIKSFVVAPGFIQTDMAQDFIDQYGENYVLDDIALDKLTQPQDLAPLVVFLLSGLADHATASTFSVNAGSYIH